MSEMNLNEKNITALVHGLGGLFYFLPALIAYLAMGDISPQYKEQLRRALNFQIFMTIVLFATQVLVFFSFGLLFFLPFVVSLVNIIIAIQAAIAINNDNLEYSYPISIAFIKPKNYME